jgi:hypothetical protein
MSGPFLVQIGERAAEDQALAPCVLDAPADAEDEQGVRLPALPGAAVERLVDILVP